MTQQTKEWLHHGQSVNLSNNPSLLSDAITACLSKAEALTTVAATSGLDVCEPDTMENYFWTLHDLIKEARFLYGKFQNLE